MSLKKSLKAAKQAIENVDPPSALEHVEEALSYDDKSYFAYLFKGKAYHLMGNLEEASKAYKIAVSIEPENLFAWKGWFLVVKSDDNYDLFFQVAGDYLEVLLNQGVMLSETVRDIQIYLKQNDIRKNESLQVLYLRSIIPGSKIGNICGELFQRPDTSLRQLLDIILPKERELVTNNVRKEKMKYSSTVNEQQKSNIDMVAWAVYSQSDIPYLYNQLINCTDDDSERRQYEEESLKYKYETLKVAPANAKLELQEELKDMVEGMVLVKHSSLLCWTLYFDWADPKSLGQLDERNVHTFIKMFQNEGLGTLLYAFIMSDISPFDRKKFLKNQNDQESATKKTNLKKNKEKNKKIKVVDSESDDFERSKEEIEEFKAVEENDDTTYDDSLSPGEVLSLMVEAFDSCKGSLLANRIIINYYIHLKEYESALDICTQGIHLLASVQRSTSFQLENTKEDLLVSLAIIYTYFESPKNFSKALQIYNTVLAKNKDNVKAKIGKGLILVEKNDLGSAKELLGQVVAEFPEDNEALLEYSWCQIKIGEFDDGREGLLKALESVKGLDLNSAELRAVIYYRIALSLLSDNSKQIDEKNQEAYKYLILSLKSSPNFAPAYTSLGILYRDFYHDEARATKCFYKSFELDASEIVAARFLVEDFTNNEEWEMAEILSKRIVSSEKARRALPNYIDSAWPYRVLGCAALSVQDDAKAVEWFQSALRLSPKDVQCWTGLGEAYFNCGRLEASVKVYNHTLTIDENNWSARYMLGVVTAHVGEFESSIKILTDLLMDKPNEECVLCSLYETLLARGNFFVKGGFFGRAVDSIIEAVSLIERASDINITSQKLWKSLAESIKIFLLIQEHLPQLPFEPLLNVVNKITQSDNTLVAELSVLDKLSESEIYSQAKDGEYIGAACELLILCEKSAINVLPLKSHKALRSISYYNLGLAYFEAFNHTKKEKYKECSIKALKKSIQLESNNAASWLTLGNAYVSSNPPIAQHCYIKATSLDPRDSSIWTNLAAMYLRYGDSELAQEAFMRAQSIAPDQSPAWLGNALAAEASGDTESAARLFTHAFILSNGRSPLAQLLYGLSILTRRVGNNDDIRDIDATQELSVANFAMMNYLKYCPNDKVGLTIAVGITERCNKYEMGILFGERLSSILEKEYENTETYSTLIDFAKTKAQLARLYLGTSNYGKAMEYAQVALDLVDDKAEQSETQKKDNSSLILSSRVVVGLANFFNNEFNQALNQLKLILSNEDDAGSKRIIVLIAQILYAQNTEATKQACLDQLFADIEENGTSLIVALTIGAICITEKLDDYFPAIKEELESLPLNELSNDTFKSVPNLLSEISKRITSGQDPKIWQRNALLFPQDYNVWKNINVNLALKVASLSNVKVTSVELADSYMKAGKLREIQRGIILNPGGTEALMALKKCIK